MYAIRYYSRRGKWRKATFDCIESALKVANKIYQKTGAIVGIEEVKDGKEA